MIRTAQPHLARALVLLALLTSAAVAPTASRAQDLIPPKTLDRHFPQFQFCPIEFNLAFVADGPQATLEFSCLVWLKDPDTGDPVWSAQAIDDVCLANTADFAANFGSPPDGSTASLCYLSDPVGSFFFNRAGLTLPYLELFNTDPVVRGWDESHGAYFRTDVSAPTNPEADTGYNTGGSLGLGEDSTTPVLGTKATTQVIVPGLVQGRSYTLSGWWYVGNVVTDVYGQPMNALTIRILGAGSTPVVQRTFGAIKREFRNR